MRQPTFLLIIGTTGTGKTTLILKLIETKLKTEQDRVLILNPNDEKLAAYKAIHLKDKELKSFTGIRTTYIIEKDDWANLKNFRNGLLVLDDMRRYIPSTLPMVLQDIFINNRHYGIDIVSVGHGFTAIPPAFYMFAKKIVLFKTTDSVKLRKNELGSHFEKVEKAIEKVNEMYQENKYSKLIINLL